MAALRTNIFLVDVDDAMVDVGVLAPYNRDCHQALDKAHGKEYVFRRRADALEAVALVPNATELADASFEPRSVRRLGKLLNTLVERAIENHLASPNVGIVRRRPIKLVSLEPKNDIARLLFGDRTQHRLPLYVRRGFSLEARTVFPKPGPRTALVIDATTHADLDGTCADLLADNFDLRGLYVLSLDPADARHGRPSLVGHVQRVEGGQCILEPTGEASGLNTTHPH